MADRALVDYDQAIKLNPKSDIAYLNRGIAYKAKGDLDRAITDYDQAIIHNPKSFVAYTLRALAYTAKGDPDRAAADMGMSKKLRGVR